MLEATARQFLYTSVTALATGKRPAYWANGAKHKLHWVLICSGQQIAKQLGLQEDTGGVDHRRGGSRVCLWFLAFASLAREPASNLNFLPEQQIS